MFKKLFNSFLTSLVIVSLLLSPCLARENKWTSKPPLGSVIDWSHPLSKGLVGCWLMNEGGGKNVNDISGNNLNGVISNGEWKPSTKGISIYQNATDEINVSYKSQLNVRHITIVSSVKYFSLTGEQELLSRWHSINAVNQECYLLSKSSTNFFTGYIYDGANRIATSPFNVVTGVDYQVAFSYDRTCKLYVNGILVTIGNTGGLINVPIQKEPLQIGYLKYNQLHYYTTLGYIYYTYLYNRALSPSEIQSLYIAPYQMIKMPSLMEYGTVTIEAYSGWVNIINN